MDKIYQVIGFFTATFAVLFYVGGMMNPAIIFIFSTLLFIGLSLLKLKEQIYLYVFMGYLTACFIGIFYYANFAMNS